MATPEVTRRVRCPVCSESVEWGPQSPFRPFCSERCRKIDLGAWAAEEYRVPEVAPSPDADPSSET